MASRQSTCRRPSDRVKLPLTRGDTSLLTAPLHQNLKRSATCIVLGPPIVDVMDPIVPTPAAGSVEFGLEKVA